MAAPNADDQVLAGQAAYNRFVLELYDTVVLRLSCRLIWRCPKRLMLDNYQRNVGARHLELGVGTAYFPHVCAFPAPPDITLVDLNPTVLRVGARRLARYRPTEIRADVLQRLPVESGSYDSVAMNFLLHCVPGGWPDKGAVFRNAADALRPGGRVFGSTILSGGVPVTAAARHLMGVYNSRGIFHNTADDLDGLRAQLAGSFPQHQITTRGNVALFEATR
ncbi:class I SAM-dependent methyltransferase [Mangrovihabitans endophyticus]|uniref:Methyltransferase n=1 Tax=Mangrovihabitans endophyticus TaxID=1751298 RepID=A0A8J3C2Q8_9ACTN|nr:class I SAM-dependent methyltransferase [Mangrovihabitans endophyticus]GGL00933.1 methyltransferase [Mangrovihabitans endophyticus]